MIQLREQYWAAEVPNDAFNFCINSNGLGYYANIKWFDKMHYDTLPPGTWQIVCTSKEVSAEKANLIVETQDELFYKCYGGNRPHVSVIGSFWCLLASKGCDINKNYLILKKTA